MKLLLSIVATYCLITCSSAQISSCDAVGCPTDQSGKSNCTLGNSTAAALGTLSFNISLSPQPLNWTLSVQSLNAAENLYERDFFLGMPSSLNASTNNSSEATSSEKLHACALFFDGMAPKLRFSGHDVQHDQGTCVDALSASCIAEMQDKARAELSKIFHNSSSNNSTTTSVCESLGDALRDSAPSSCTVTSGGQWGSILSRSLSSMDLAQPIEQGTCHQATKDGDYSIRLIAADQVKAASRNTTDVENVLYGVTPIMTVVFEPGEQDTRNAQIDLSCLKAIEPTGGNVSRSDSHHDSGVMGSGGGRSAALVLAAISASTFLFLLNGDIL